MKRQDYIIVLLLFFFALFIWLRDLAWLTSADDTLPVLVSIPLFLWLGDPWEFRSDDASLSTNGITAVVALLVAGVLLNLTLLLAASWTLLLWIWLKVRTPAERHDNIRKLLVFAFIAFPWIALDFDRVGWWFRLSGASVTGDVYGILGFSVLQDGTNLTVENLPISVEAACSGMNTLQSMLIAGSVANYMILGETSRYWWNIPLLFVISWVANTIRIIALVAAALIVSRDFAMGTFHTWGGWAIIVVMFVICWMILSLQEPKNENS